MLTIRPVNDTPTVVEYPVQVVPNEGDLVEFTIRAEDLDGDQLILAMTDDGGTIELGADFEDNGDGTGTYSWQTDFTHAGHYLTNFSIDDQVGGTVSVSVVIIVGNVNRAPTVVTSIPDSTFDEDTGPWEIIDVGTVFADPDNDNLRYSIDAHADLDVELDANLMLIVSAPDNYNGSDLPIVVAAFDGTVTSADTFMVTINPINDLPSAYSLINPHKYQIITSPWVIFRWQESEDVVEQTPITYSLVLCFNDTLYWHTDLDVTEMLMSRSSLIVDPNDSTQVEWWVYAYDDMDSVRSTETFKFTVAPIVVEEEEEVLLPTELKLGPVYPNPFNDIITIKFDLPWEGFTTVDVLDLRGRVIRTLVATGRDVGRYRTYWDGMDKTGARVASGIYLCRLKIRNSERMVRIVLLR